MTHVNSCIAGPAHILKAEGRVRIMRGKTKGNLGPVRPKGSACCWRCNRLLMTPNEQGEVAGKIKCPRPQCDAINII